MVREHTGDHSSEWSAIVSISSKIGCTAETLRRWMRDTERREDPKQVAVLDDKARLRELEREVRELRQANEILRKASAYFAQAELDRPFKW
jgi:transposase-like protein